MNDRAEIRALLRRHPEVLVAVRAAVEVLLDRLLVDVLLAAGADLPQAAGHLLLAAEGPAHQAYAPTARSRRSRRWI